MEHHIKGWLTDYPCFVNLATNGFLSKTQDKWIGEWHRFYNEGKNLFIWLKINTQILQTNCHRRPSEIKVSLMTKNSGSVHSSHDDDDAD